MEAPIVGSGQLAGGRHSLRAPHLAPRKRADDPAGLTQRTRSLCRERDSRNLLPTADSCLATDRPGDQIIDRLDVRGLCNVVIHAGLA